MGSFYNPSLGFILQNCAVTGTDVWVISINLYSDSYVVGGLVIFSLVIGFLQLEVRFFYYT